MAAEEAFPNVRVKGCLFHFGQSLWRKLHGFGLTEDYKSNPDIAGWFRRLRGFALVHLNLLDNLAAEIINEHHPNVQGVIQFQVYFVKTYLDDEGLSFRQ